jgi:hypothetical protein
MATTKPTMKTGQCGNTKVSYDARCTYICICEPGKQCNWSVDCNGMVTTGTGFKAPPSGHPWPSGATVAGKLEVCAKVLEKILKRPVIVPPDLRGKTIAKRTFRGTPEQIAQALGFELGPKRKR